MIHPLRCALVATLAFGAMGAAQADGRWTYEVTVTNITYQQRFTPLLLAVHQPSVGLFELGEPASDGLRVLAEEGNGGPLKAVLDTVPQVSSTVAGNSLLDPGKSISFRVRANPWRERLSVAGMLIPTNDAFMAIDTVPFPTTAAGSSHFALAYDSGTEVNDELCSSIPGPNFAECGGNGGGARVGGGEGFVHIHRGMHGVGSFTAAARDWRNPVARVTIKFVRAN
jgi:hypothetical protein